ncbi:MAG TPA: RsmE family RNA methyltransferase, partial [Gemmataceae bacterium]|nr:RsmE family RNA methyltransferase [Gemmataceae bacterium]
DLPPRRILAHPGGDKRGRDSIAQMSPDPFLDPLDTIIAVGPEGGFTEEEAALAIAAGWRMVDLGPRILRVETAAIALAVLYGLAGSRTNHSM